MANVSAKRSSGSAQAPRAIARARTARRAGSRVQLAFSAVRHEREVDHMPELVQRRPVALERRGAVEARDVEVDGEALAARRG